RLLLRLALHPEHPRLDADPGGRELPADDDPHHPRRAYRRPSVRPGRFALADGRRDDAGEHLAAPLSARGSSLDVLDAAARDAARRARDGDDDVSDDRGRDGLGAGGQGRRGLRGAEQLPPAGRLARDRVDGSDPGVLRHGFSALAPRSAAVRRRPARGVARRSRDHVRCGDRRRGLRADADRGRARAHRGGGRMTATAPRMAAADRRRHLIETAIRLFTEGSYHGTTTAEIARAAGVSEPILYRHFASKRDLYIAALDHVWEKAKGIWEAKLLGASDVSQGLDDVGRGHFSVRDCKFQLAELWVQALGEASEGGELRTHMRRPMREVHDFAASTIRRGQAEGSLHPDRDAEAEAWVFMAGGLFGMVGRRGGGPGDDQGGPLPKGPLGLGWGER